MKAVMPTMTLAVVMASAWVMSGGALADDQGAVMGTRSTQGDLSEKAQKFIEKAAKGNMGEVALGEVAREKGSSDAVRQFGARMAEEHGKANDELKAIAQAKGVQWPEQLKEQHQELADELSQLSGQEFDQKYMKEMVKAHEKDVEKYEKMAQEIEDPEVKQYIEGTLPVLREHLELAKQIEDNKD